MEIPEGLKYSKQHHWVAAEDSVATIGVTDYGQQQLGEIVYIELPEIGEKVSKDDPFGSIESVTAASDLYAPITGKVLEVNQELPQSPEMINEDPYGDGWLIKIEIGDAGELRELMDSQQYDEMTEADNE